MEKHVDRHSDSDENISGSAVHPLDPRGKDVDAIVSEKNPPDLSFVELNEFERNQVETDLNVTEEDLAEAKQLASSYTLEGVRNLMESVLKTHSRDPNFPFSVLEKIREFLSNEGVFSNPEKHEELIWEMKLEAALITNNSPYSEVRAVVDNHDDPAMQAGTIRAWTIGIVFSCLISLINQLFEIRFPGIYVDNNVAQLLAYPLGMAWAKWLPVGRFKVFGKEFVLNPGPFNKKEHMLITIMASIAKSLPYTQYIIWTSAMPFFFNFQYARSFTYQILIALSTNFIGYGLAGLTRRFLVYPSFCVWPASLVTIALNSALHDDKNVPVMGPFKKMWTMSRYKFFLIAFCGMFVYFWIPEVLFNCLQMFNWMAWIAPTNFKLNLLTSGSTGMALLNPIPTFDWNIVMSMTDPLMVPAFATFNYVAGAFFGALISLGIYLSNTYNTGYFPISTNKLWTDRATRYNVSRILTDEGMFDQEKYMAYSAAYLGASNIVVYACFFAAYAAVVTYVILFHHNDLRMAFSNIWGQIRRKKGEPSKNHGEYEDIHNKLMKVYPEVSGWYYFGILIIAAAFGFAGIASFPTHTTLAVIPYGAIMCIIMVIPIGLVKAMTGTEVTLNVLAEFIGGMWVAGNALAMNFFKSYGYVTCAHAIHFANDMKLAHYTKIPPWTTFIAQLLATLLSTFISTALMRWQLDLPNVCTAEAPMKFTCPGPQTFFTASVLWGSIGPAKIFGYNGQYKLLLLGWLVGFLLVVAFWALIKFLPRNRYIRQFHPVVFATGPLSLSPYNFAYFWPAVPFAWLSWIYVRSRFLGLWSKYNFVLSAAFSAGIAVSAIVIFFAIAWPDVYPEWAGNEINSKGCGGEITCYLLKLATGECFKPWWDGKNGVEAPGL